MIWHDLLLCYFSHLIKSSCLPSCVVFQWFPAHNCPRSKTVQPHGFCSGNDIEFNARDSNIVGPNCTELSGPEGFLMALVPVTGSFTSLNITATECHWNMSRLNLFESIWIFSDSAAGYWPELAKICKELQRYKTCSSPRSPWKPTHQSSALRLSLSTAYEIHWIEMRNASA